MKRARCSFGLVDPRSHIRVPFTVAERLHTPSLGFFLKCKFHSWRTLIIDAKQHLEIITPRIRRILTATSCIWASITCQQLHTLRHVFSPSYYLQPPPKDIFRKLGRHVDLKTRICGEKSLPGYSRISNPVTPFAKNASCISSLTSVLENKAVDITSQSSCTCEPMIQLQAKTHPQALGRNSQHSEIGATSLCTVCAFNCGCFRRYHPVSPHRQTPVICSDQWRRCRN